MNKKIPHFVTVSYNFKHRFTEETEDLRHTLEIKEIYDKRKRTIERVFADANEKNEKHDIRYTTLKGMAQVSKWVKLKFAYMNLKKICLHLRNGKLQFSHNNLIINILVTIPPSSFEDGGY